MCAALLTVLQAGSDAPPPPPKPPTPPPVVREPVPPPEPPAGSPPRRASRQPKQVQAQPKQVQQGEGDEMLSVAEGAATTAEAGTGAEAGVEAVPPPPPAEDTCRHLTEAELRVVVGMLPASLGGSILGSALCWQQADLVGWAGVRAGVGLGLGLGYGWVSYPSPLP